MSSSSGEACWQLLYPVTLLFTANVTYGVAWSDCRSVMIMGPAKMAELIEMLFGLWTWMCHRKHVLDGGPHPQCEGAILTGKEAAHLITPSHRGRVTIEFDEEGIQPIENLEPLDATGPGLDWSSHGIVIECVFQRCHFIC